MAYDFRECLKALTDAKEEFNPKLYPLSRLETVAPVVKKGVTISAKDIIENLLRTAERKFNYSHRTKADFYGYLFDTLYESALSKSDGVEASSMYVVYQNAMNVFPLFAKLPFQERYKILVEATKKTRKFSERNLKGYAMCTYLVLVAHNLDNEVLLPDDGFHQKSSYDSPWRTPDGKDHVRLYVKAFQNFKKLQDFDTGRVKDPHYPVWTTFKLKDNYRGVNRTMLSVDIWTMLTESPDGNQ